MQHYIVQIRWYNTIKYNSHVGCTNLIYQVHTTLDQFDYTPIEVGWFLMEIARDPQGLPIQISTHLVEPQTTVLIPKKERKQHQRKKPNPL